MKRALLVLAFSLGLSAQSYYFAPNPVQVGPTGAFQIYVCQTLACATLNAGAEAFYSKPSGGCTDIYQMSVDGSNQTEIGSTYTANGALPTPFGSYNLGSPRWNPAGTWFVMEAQNQATMLACSAGDAKVGVGFGFSVFLCRVSDQTCYLIAIEGDNTGHFCSVNVACTVNPSALTTWVDDNHGFLHAHFTPDGTKIYGMYIMQHAIGVNSWNFSGTARWATVTLPSSGAPTLSDVTEVDIGPMGTGGATTGQFNVYEGAGAMPTSIEPTTETLFFTNQNNGDGSLNHIGTVMYNIATQTATQLPPMTSYSEWWEVRPQGDIAVGTTGVYLPPTLGPVNANGGEAGPLDLASGPPETGRTTQMTFFNNLHPLGNPLFLMSDPCWDWTGTYVFLNSLPADNATHTASASYIFKYTVETTPIPAVQVSGLVTLAGATLQ